MKQDDTAYTIAPGQTSPTEKRSLFLPILRLLSVRIGLGVLTMLLMSILIFGATELLPGDPAQIMLGRNANAESIAKLREQMGLNEPALTRYVDWMSGALHGDLGISITTGRPVSELIADRVANSMTLVLLATIISVPISVVLGSLSGAKSDGFFDGVVSLMTVIFASLPEFVVGIVLILIFSTGLLHLLPPVSMLDLSRPAWQQLHLLIFPAIVLGLAVVPYITRMLRSSVQEVFESDFIQMARMKGVRERIILVRHVLPNALAPTVQAVALSLAWMTGGIVVVEYLFNFAGIGSVLVESVESRDLPMVQAIVLLITGFYVVANVVADIITILLSPRVRTSL